MLRVSPTAPIIKTMIGDSMGSTWINRWIDWRKMERARARRKTPLKKAPGTWQIFIILYSGTTSKPYRQVPHGGRQR
jgi:hypothetical protein